MSSNKSSLAARQKQRISTNSSLAGRPRTSTNSSLVGRQRTSTKKPPTLENLLRNNQLSFLVVILLIVMVIFIIVLLLAVKYSRKKPKKIQRKGVIIKRNPQTIDGEETDLSAFLVPNPEKTSDNIGPTGEISISDQNTNAISSDTFRHSTISSTNNPVNEKDDLSEVDFNSIPLRSFNSTSPNPNDQSSSSTADPSSSNSPGNIYEEEFRKRDIIVRPPPSPVSTASKSSEESCL